MVSRTHAQRHVAGLDSRGFRVLAWIGVAVQVVALAAVLVLQRWVGGLSLAIFLGLSVLFLALEERLPNLIVLLVVTAALINAALWAWNLSQPVAFYDEATHAYSSFAVVSALGWLAWTRRWIRVPPHGARFLVTMAALGLGLGILWEIVEFVFLDIPFWDTVGDLVMDAIGAFCAGLFLAWAIRRKGAEPGGVIRPVHGVAGKSGNGRAASASSRGQ